MKKVIYTCITGGYDELRQPLAVRSDWDYICFTDSGAKGCEGVWQFRPIGFDNADPRVSSRYPKILPHRVLEEYDWSFYLDPNIQITDDSLYDAIEARIAEGVLWSGVPHPSCDCIYTEAENCYKAGHIRFRDALGIKRKLEEEGFPIHYGMMENNLILRKHNDDRIAKVDELWWAGFSTGPHRDQLYLMPLLFEAGIYPEDLLPDSLNARNCQSLKYFPHSTPYKPKYPRPRMLRRLLTPLLETVNTFVHTASEEDTISGSAGQPVHAPAGTPNMSDAKGPAGNAVPDVSVVIVSMNRPDILYPCLESIRKHNSCNYEILLVAYRFSEDNLNALKRDWPEVKVIVNNALSGFAENNNLALKEARGRYCFIVNDDTVMDMPVIDTLFSDFDRVPENTAAISPKIIFGDGSVQTCGRGPWRALKYLAHYLHLVDETRRGEWTMQEGLFRTWTLNGACFIIRTDIFSSLGWFDETYTFTPEDIALGHLINDSGYEVWVDADAVITHLAGSTAGPMESAIKPTRIRGSLLFYAKGKPLKYALMGVFVILYESLRVLKWLPADRKDPNSHAAVMYRTAKNVIKSVFSQKSTKQIFTELYNELPSPSGKKA